MGRVLIALSFKSFKRRNEVFRRGREKSDCSDAFILPVVEEERGSQQDEVGCGFGGLWNKNFNK